MSRDADPDSDRAPVDAGPEEYKVFVGGISWHMNDRELLRTFEKYRPADARVMLDKITNRSRGFGFVTFNDKALMEKAVAEMHEVTIENRKISVNKAIPQSETAPGTPAAALARGGSRDRYGDRPPRGERYERSERGYRGGDRYGPPGGYDRAYPAYERRGYDRYAERGYERGGGYGEIDRGYDRGYPPASYGGYERGEPYGYGREPYSRDAYPPADRYAGVEYERGGGGYPGGYDRYAAPSSYDREYDRYGERGPGYASRGPPLERAPADRYGRSGGGPDRDYGSSSRYGGSSRPGPYDRAPGGSARDDRSAPAPAPSSQR